MICIQSSRSLAPIGLYFDLLASFAGLAANAAFDKSKAFLLYQQLYILKREKSKPAPACSIFPFSGHAQASICRVFPMISRFSRICGNDRYSQRLISADCGKHFPFSTHFAAFFTLFLLREARSAMYASFSSEI
ncbi:MAG: hypothetical protein Q4G00_01980 [Clostridia bacterium]|nr:hypothetical protein [Clostridia bacterium]